MNRSVLAVGGASVTVADQLAFGVDGYVFADKSASIVRVQERILGLQLKSIHR
jgi:hypothetical protein